MTGRKQGAGVQQAELGWTVMFDPIVIFTNEPYRSGKSSVRTSKT
jgi:hypothetical protein